MHFYKIGIALIASAYGVLSAVDDSCSSGNGVCISTSNCKKMGGTYESGLCPNDPEDIKCCKKSSCTVDGKTGVCKLTSNCKGTSLPGVCPGPSNFQCCVSDTDTGTGTSCSYQGLTGTCKNVSNCNGFRVKGLCPGPADVQCCLPKNTCMDSGKSGVCIPDDQCDGYNVVGKCPGGKDIKCCIGGGSTSCSYQGLTGTCKNVSNCNGFRVRGLCPGPADVQCCLPKHSCSDGGKSGVCIPDGQCDGYNVVGKCPGGKDIKCCIGGGGTSCSYQGLSGTCKNVSNCNGFRVKGLCPGPADVQCCLPKHSCSDGGKSGQCIPTGQCGGRTVTGKCPGGKDIKCCLGGSGGGSSIDCVDHHTISSAAVAIAWETKDMGKGNDGTSLYIKVKDAIFPNDPYYQSCDRGVATAVRWSGADDKFPVGDTKKQDSYLSGSSLWTFIGKYDQNYSKLKPGDIVITTPSRRGTNHGHIVLYVGNEAITKRYPNSKAEFVSASYKDRSPGCGDSKSLYVGDGYHIYRYNGSYKGSDYYAYAVCTNDSISCSYNGTSGKCMYTSECNKIKGTYYSGLCPGPNDFKCCISSSSSNSKSTTITKNTVNSGNTSSDWKCSDHKVCKLAYDYIGSTKFAKAVETKSDNKDVVFNKGDWKCNLFIYEMLYESGIDIGTPNRSFHKGLDAFGVTIVSVDGTPRPPAALDWYNFDKTINGETSKLPKLFYLVAKVEENERSRYPYSNKYPSATEYLYDVTRPGDIITTGEHMGIVSKIFDSSSGNTGDIGVCINTSSLNVRHNAFGFRASDKHVRIYRLKNEYLDKVLSK